MKKSEIDARPSFDTESDWIVPGTLSGAHEPSGLSAAHCAHAPDENVTRWTKVEQHAQIARWYHGAALAGIVWA